MLILLPFILINIVVQASHIVVNISVNFQRNSEQQSGESDMTLLFCGNVYNVQYTVVKVLLLLYVF